MRKYNISLALGRAEQIDRIERVLPRLKEPHSEHAFYHRIDDRLTICIHPFLLNSENMTEDFSSHCKLNEADLVVLAGTGFAHDEYETSIRSANNAVISICSKTWSPVFDEGTHVTDNFSSFGEMRKRVIGEHMCSKDWHDLYYHFGHNDEPNCKWSENLLIGHEYASRVEEICEANDSIDIVEEKLPSHPSLLELKTLRAIPVLTTSCEFDFTTNSTEGFDRFESSTLASFDAQLAFALFLAAHDIQNRNSEHDRASTGTARQTAELNQITFEGSNDEILRRCIRHIADVMPDRSIDIIKESPGSLVFEFKSTAKDAMVLHALRSSGLLTKLTQDFLVKSANNVEEAREAYRFKADGPPLHYDLKTIPLLFTNFADDILSIGDSLNFGDRYGHIIYRDFYDVWGSVPELQALSKLIRDSSSIDEEFMRCG